MVLVAELDVVAVLHVGYVIAVSVVVVAVVAVAGFPLVIVVDLDLHGGAVYLWFPFASFVQSTLQQHSGTPQLWHFPFVFCSLFSFHQTFWVFWIYLS